MLAIVGLLAIAPSLILAQGSGYTPLASRIIPYEDRPYKIDTDASGRGPQSGYNNCSMEATGGPDSLCQTAFVNSLEDFCLWGLPQPGETVGDSEAEAVAFCTLPTHGTRVIPAGTIYGAQFIQTPKFIQVTGYLRQTGLNIQEGDYGGEMDPIGADQRGNPLGGLMYSTAFNSNGSIQQTRYWTNFMGADTFCIKVCIPDGPDAARECEHIYDRIGCAYNIYADYPAINGTFESCEGDVGLYAGVYVGDNGRTSTYTQPAESLGVISTIPYTPSIPPSSSCTSLVTQPAAFLIAGREVTSAAVSGASSAVDSAGAVPTDSAIVTTTSSGAAQAAPTSRVNAVSGSPRPSVSTPTSGASALAASSILIGSSLAFFALFA